MQLSVMLFPFHSAISQGRLQPEELVKALHDAGATGLEPMYGWNEKDPDNWRRLCQAAGDLGMAFVCYDIKANLVGDGDDSRKQAIDTCKQQIDYAAQVLHCPTVLVYGSNITPGMSNDEGWRIYGEQLACLADYARPAGITVTIEDFDPHPRFVASAHSCRQVLDLAGPAVGLTFDTGNFLNGGDQPAEIFPLLQDRIRHVHVKDKTRRPPDNLPSNTGVNGVQYKGCLIGEGAAQIGLCVELLKNCGYQKWLSVEIGSDKVADAVHGLRFLAKSTT
ncbi:MAG: sugar phosphate isomerase/epimerase [Lentisphaeria bacterium]|nr:sugar phosphate isomerase/epimerase [Lentisphaeria bacterium]